MNSHLQVPEEQLRIIRTLLQEYVPHCDVRAFGSRVTGRFKPQSDLDIAIIHNQPIDALVLAKLRLAFEESPLPWKVDVIEYHAVSPAFRRAIDFVNVPVHQ